MLILLTPVLYAHNFNIDSYVSNSVKLLTNVHKKVVYLSPSFYKLPNYFNPNFWDAVHKRCRHLHPRHGGLTKVGREVPRYLQRYTRQNILTTATCNRILAKVRKLGVCLPFFSYIPFPPSAIMLIRRDAGPSLTCTRCN